MRHVRDALVGSDTLGDILVGCEPPASYTWLIPDLDQAAVPCLNNRALTRADRAQHVIAIGPDITIEGPRIVPVLDHVTEIGARLHNLGGQPLHFDVATVTYDEPFVLIEHEKTLAHGVHRRIEPLLLHREPPCHLAEDQEESKNE
jgi:hypothetical protein